MKKLMIMLLFLGLVGCEISNGEVEDPTTPDVETPTNPEEEKPCEPDTETPTDPETEKPTTPDEEEEPEVDEVFNAPDIYKYYINSDLTLDQNIAAALDKANLESDSVAPIVVDDNYNTMVFVQVKSPIQTVGKLSFNLDQLDHVDYDVDAYMDEYRDEGVTLVEEPEDELIVLLCNESEGIPSTAIWYENMDGELTTIVLQYNGVEQEEGLIDSTQSEIEKPTVGEAFIAPVFYKYYVDQTLTLDENVAQALEKAALQASNVAPIVVDDTYNTIVLINVKSQLSNIGKISFDIDQLDSVDYSIDQYIAQYSDEGVVLVEQPEDELIILLCNESEGIPTTALWYEDETGELTTIVLEYNGAQQSEGLIE